MTPKSYGTSGRIKELAWAREVQHRSGCSSLVAKVSIGRGAPVLMFIKTPLIRLVVRGLSSSFCASGVGCTQALIRVCSFWRCDTGKRAESGCHRRSRRVRSHERDATREELFSAPQRADIAAGRVTHARAVRTALTLLFGPMTSI